MNVHHAIGAHDALFRVDADCPSAEHGLNCMRPVKRFTVNQELLFRLGAKEELLGERRAIVGQMIAA